MNTLPKGTVLLAAVAILVILGGTLMFLTACNNQQKAEAADPAASDVSPEGETVIERGLAHDWIVVHQKRTAESSDDGKELCTVTPGFEITYLPAECMLVEEGDWIGFANYYNSYVAGESISGDTGGAAVTCELKPTSLFGVPEITLAYQETKILQIKHLPPSAQMINIVLDETGGDHGGPTIVPVQPPN